MQLVSNHCAPQWTSTTSCWEETSRPSKWDDLDKLCAMNLLQCHLYAHHCAPNMSYKCATFLATACPCNCYTCHSWHPKRSHRDHASWLSAESSMYSAYCGWSCAQPANLCPCSEYKWSAAKAFQTNLTTWLLGTFMSQMVLLWNHRQMLRKGHLESLGTIWADKRRRGNVLLLDVLKGNRGKNAPNAKARNTSRFASTKLGKPLHSLLVLHRMSPPNMGNDFNDCPAATWRWSLQIGQHQVAVPLVFNCLAKLSGWEKASPGMFFKGVQVLRLSPFSDLHVWSNLVIESTLLSDLQLRRSFSTESVLEPADDLGEKPPARVQP